MRIHVGLILVSVLWAGPAAAQWFAYPTPGTPRTADGKPNLTAPAPRTPDGKPDLSGIWTTPSGRWLNNLAADGVEVPFKPWALALFKERQANNGRAVRPSAAFRTASPISTPCPRRPRSSRRRP